MPTATKTAAKKSATRKYSPAASKSVDIDCAPHLILEDLGIEIEIPREGVELLLGPRSDDGDVGHYEPLTRAAGNSLHSRPSNSRPPDFGRSPPHCLKKKATFWARH